MEYIPYCEYISHSILHNNFSQYLTGSRGGAPQSGVDGRGDFAARERAAQKVRDARDPTI
jgi:hypothetical protein